MPPVCTTVNVLSFMYVCYICYFSSTVGSSEAVSCETLPPQQLKVSESLLQQSELFIACSLPLSLSTFYSYPLLLLPLSYRVLFFFIDVQRFFTYGDMPLSKHLEQIEREALSRFEQSSPSLEVPLEPKWSQPVSELNESSLVYVEYYIYNMFC